MFFCAVVQLHVHTQVGNCSIDVYVHTLHIQNYLYIHTATEKQLFLDKSIYLIVQIGTDLQALHPSKWEQQKPQK